MTATIEAPPDAGAEVTVITTDTNGKTATVFEGSIEDMKKATATPETPKDKDNDKKLSVAGIGKLLNKVVKAVEDACAGRDRDGRARLWGAAAYELASASRQFYQQQHQTLVDVPLKQPFTESDHNARIRAYNEGLGARQSETETFKRLAKEAKDAEDEALSELQMVIRDGPGSLPLIEAAEKAAPASPEAWRSVELKTLGLPESLLEKLAEGDITTIGAITDLQEKHGDFWQKNMPKGIGAGKCEVLSDALLKFWTDHPEYLETKSAASAEGSPAAVEQDGNPTPVDTPAAGGDSATEKAKKPAKKTKAKSKGGRGK